MCFVQWEDTFLSLKIKSYCQPLFHFWAGWHQTLKHYLHNCQSDINNFEDTDLGLEGVLRNICLQIISECWCRITSSLQKVRVSQNVMAHDIWHFCLSLYLFNFVICHERTLSPHPKDFSLFCAVSLTKKILISFENSLKPQNIHKECGFQ